MKGVDSREGVEEGVEEKLCLFSDLLPLHPYHPFRERILTVVVEGPDRGFENRPREGVKGWRAFPHRERQRAEMAGFGT